jgi:hypothetical protein
MFAALACGGRTDQLGGGSSSSGGSSGGSSGSSSGGSSGGSSGSSSGGGCPTLAFTTPPTGSCDSAVLAGCSFPASIPYCGSSIDVTCTCPSGTWSCPGPPVPKCACPDPSQVQPGGKCFVGESTGCASTIPIYGCNGLEGYETCDCIGGAWECLTPGPPDCPDASPPPLCPEPQKVAQGIACTEEGQQCPGNPTVCGGATLYDAFQCTNGQWDDVATTICDVDAGGHP